MELNSSIDIGIIILVVENPMNQWRTEHRFPFIYFGFLFWVSEINEVKAPNSWWNNSTFQMELTAGIMSPVHVLNNFVYIYRDKRVSFCVEMANRFFNDNTETDSGCLEKWKKKKNFCILCCLLKFFEANFRRPHLYEKWKLVGRMKPESNDFTNKKKTTKRLKIGIFFSSRISFSFYEVRKLTKCRTVLTTSRFDTWPTSMSPIRTANLRLSVIDILTTSSGRLISLYGGRVKSAIFTTFLFCSFI